MILIAQVDQRTLMRWLADNAAAYDKARTLDNALALWWLMGEISRRTRSGKGKLETSTRADVALLSSAELIRTTAERKDIEVWLAKMAARDTIISEKELARALFAARDKLDSAEA